MAIASRRRLALLGRRNGARPEAPVEGVARLGERTKHLVKRLRPGEVAVIDHVDIDRIAAEELIEAEVVAVLNASPSSQGRYPNAGPLMLARAGVKLIDAPEADLFERLSDGDRVRIVGESILVDGEEVARGRALGVAELEREMQEHRKRIDEALGEVGENPGAHVPQETDLRTGTTAV